MKHIIKRLCSLLLVLCLVLIMMPVPIHAATYYTTEQISAKLASWKSKLNGKYWNYYDRTVYDSRRSEVEANLKAIVDNGILDSSNPTNAQLGVTTSACSGSLYENGCRSNYFSGGWQCFGFAWWLEYALFQSTYQMNSSDWYVYSGSSLNSINLQPGDLVRVSGHSIVVSDVSGGALNCVEAWGGSGCKISWSPGFNWSEYSTASSMLNAVKNNGGKVYRYKYIGEGSYAISYNANGGSGAPSSQTKQHGSSLTLSSTVPERFSYNFLGWSTSSTATSATYVPGDTFTDNSNTTLYAVWQTAGLIPQSWEWVEGSSNISFGGEYQYLCFTPTTNNYYRLESTGNLDPQVFIYDVNGNQLAWNDDGGSGNNFLLDYFFSAGDVYYIKTKLYNSSYTGEISYSFKHLYYIMYDANGGTGAPAEQSKVYQTGLTLSSVVPTRTGYIFRGWSTSSTATTATYLPGDTFSTNAHTTLFAVWEPESYTVSYDANGGTGAPSSQTKLYDVDLTLSTTVPQRFGYTFLGWRASCWSTGNGVYLPGGTYTETFGTTMKAIWAQAEEISTNSSFSADISFVNGYRYYAFIPPETGLYTFESTGNTDSIIYLYDDSGTQLAYDDDSGTNRNFLLSSELIGGAKYYIKVKLFGTNTGSINFSVIRRSTLVITQQPQDAYTQLGNKINISVVAEGEGLTYAWYVKDVIDPDFVKSSITGSTYAPTMTEDKNGRYAYCVITDKYGNSVTTETVRMWLTATITQQPKSVSVAEGQTARVTVQAVGDGLTYRWYYKNAGDDSYTYTSTFKGNTYSVTMTEARSGRKIFCRVSDKYSNVVQTNTVTLSMEAETLKITQQPASIFVAEGEIAKVTVQAQGNGLTYRWYYKNAGESTYTYTSTYKGNTYSMPMDEVRNGRRVLCRVYDMYGNVVQSNTVMLSMTGALKIVQQPMTVTVDEGETAKATVLISGEGVTYTWYYANPGSTKFYKTTAFSGRTYYIPMNDARNGRRVYCVITDQYGNTVKTNTVTLKMS